ncbi:MAG TPA: hypothetical protein GXZ60_13455 [Intrasporangiaceae bacterium]|nr:hypothetical protein [Intrasporangiaceae bacterium]
MSIIDDVRKTNQTTFYAAVGVLDLAVEEVRDAQARAVKARDEFRAELKSFDVKPADAQARVAALPGKTVDAVMNLVEQAGETYEDLAVRGEKLIERVRNQKATKDLMAQAENTVAQAKGAVTTARKAAADVERSAKATLTTGRKEAVRAATAIAESVQDEARHATAEVEKSVKATRTAAKRTTTTARNAAKKTTTRTKSTATSARKTAKAAPKATKKAAEKVGD